MTAELESLAAGAAEWMRRQSSEIDAEIYLGAGRGRLLARREGRPDGLEIEEFLGAGVRVFSGGRVGFACAGGVDAEGLRGLWRRAVEQLPHAAPDPGRRLPAPPPAAEDAALAASLRDDAALARPPAELDALLGRAEAAASAAGKARILRSELSETESETVVAATTGRLSRERASSSSVSVSSAAEGGGQTQVGEGFRSARRLAALDPEGAGAEAARRALAGIGARRARGGRRAVVLEPWATADFLEVLSDLASAEEVHAGRSLFAGRLGATLASSLVTLRDDPRRPGGPASALFDDEGIPTRDKAVIERGVLRELLHDSATAEREGRRPNGCGYRGDWSGLPGPAPSNFYLAPGPVTRERLLADTRDGLLVLEVLGAHMIDPVSGEFSVGVSGIEIERGDLARPFQGAMIAGNLLDLLARVDAVADDLVFHGSFGSPTLRVCALDVA